MSDSSNFLQQPSPPPTTIFDVFRTPSPGKRRKRKLSLTAKQIFDNSRKNLKDDMEFVNEFFLKLSRSISLIINLIDPDALVFGGGLSNELGSLDKIKNMTKNYLSNFNNIKDINLKTFFLKARYGDASGVRGAAILSRQNST